MLGIATILLYPHNTQQLWSTWRREKSPVLSTCALGNPFKATFSQQKHHRQEFIGHLHSLLQAKIVQVPTLMDHINFQACTTYIKAHPLFGALTSNKLVHLRELITEDGRHEWRLLEWTQSCVISTTTRTGKGNRSQTADDNQRQLRSDYVCSVRMPDRKPLRSWETRKPGLHRQGYDELQEKLLRHHHERAREGERERERWSELITWNKIGDNGKGHARTHPCSLHKCIPACSLSLSPSSAVTILKPHCLLLLQNFKNKLHLQSPATTISHRLQNLLRRTFGPTLVLPNGSTAAPRSL